MLKASGNLDEFEKQVSPVIEELLAKFKKDQHSPGVSYCVEFKNKNNAKVVRKEYYDKIRDMVTDKGYNFYVEYRDAEINFLLEVYRDLMVFAVTHGYKDEWCKYNLQQIALASGAVAQLNQEGEKAEEKVAKLGEATEVEEKKQAEEDELVKELPEAAKEAEESSDGDSP